MLRVAPILFTDHPDDWAALLAALGLEAAVQAAGWQEFDAASGRLRLHAPDASHPAGTARLAFEVGDLDEFTRRTREAGTAVVLSEEGHGRTATITGPDGLSFIATVEAARPEPATADPALRVLALWMTPDPDGSAAILRAIGARPEIASDTGGWMQFRAKNGGLVATHSGSTAAAVPSFQYDGDVQVLHARLLTAGLAADLVDESYGRTLRVPHPDGGEDLWVNEAQQDLYGYHRVDG
ncbi:VOC family protein [Arthrobacter sp. JSM 101049]|uniref:VOC family protein n=1 Tax=Arthrobacter sp. JSM 101049 TaxID=929097 RepID=UPI00356ADED0